MGDFTVADGYLFTVLNWTKMHNIDLSAFPNITAFMKRVAARPAVQEAMKAEGSAEGGGVVARRRRLGKRSNDVT